MEPPPPPHERPVLSAWRSGPPPAPRPPPTPHRLAAQRIRWENLVKGKHVMKAFLQHLGQESPSEAHNAGGESMQSNGGGSPLGDSGSRIGSKSAEW